MVKNNIQTTTNFQILTSRLSHKTANPINKKKNSTTSQSQTVNL